MADYYPLLAKAVGTVPPHDPGARQSVYTRAREALATQLNGLEPPLSPAEIGRELRDLDQSIARVEAEHATLAPPTLAPAAAQPAPDDRPPIENPGGERRRIEQPALRRGGRSRPWPLIAVLTAVAVPVAILAWIRRDPPAPASAPPTVMDTPPSSADAQPKFGERIGGTAAPPSARPPAPAPAPAASAPAAPATAPVPSSAPAEPQVAIAQRAILVEGNPNDPQQPQISVGRTIWRLDTVPSATPGQPAETVVRAEVDVPEARLKLSLVLRRNLDAGLPASHIMELTFTSSGDPPRLVRDVAPPEMRLDELTRGLQLKALPLPLKPNLFIVALSALKVELDRNVELLLRRNWLEIPVRFASGEQAILLLNKGVQGDRILADAFRRWGAG